VLQRLARLRPSRRRVSARQRAAARGGARRGRAGRARGATWLSTRNVRCSGAMLDAERPFIDSTCTRGGRCVSGGGARPPRAGGDRRGARDPARTRPEGATLAPWPSPPRGRRDETRPVSTGGRGRRGGG
jgi:hypothetical protein